MATTQYGSMDTAYAVSECSPCKGRGMILYPGREYRCAICGGSGVRVEWVKASGELEAILRERDREVDGE